MSSTNKTLCLPRSSSRSNQHHAVLLDGAIPPRDLPPNHVLIKVERFGFSANNVTYQALGEHPHFRYYDFFPVPEGKGASEKTHGIVPVWGFGTVVASTHSKIPAGERIYGYLAPARFLLLPVAPNDVNKHTFYVPRPHLPPDRRPYNQIIRCATDSQYFPSPLAEDLTMLYRPLFWTAYWFEDYIFTSGYSNATSILISSASSKTAFCLAYLIGQRISRGKINVKVVGLTSNKNLPFTTGLGLYDEVLLYDSFTSAQSLQSAKEKWLYVDVAGNDDLNKQVFAHISQSGGQLVACYALGMTNLSPASPAAASMTWNTNTFSDAQPQVSPKAIPASYELTQFFMPEWLNVRKNQLSVLEIFANQDRAWKKLMADCTGWINLERVYGAENVKRAYENVIKDGFSPEKGFIWSLWDNEEQVTAKL